MQPRTYMYYTLIAYISTSGAHFNFIMAFPFFWRKNSGKPIITEVKQSAPAIAKSTISETAKATIDLPKGFNKDVGEPHPSDFETLEEIYKNVPLVQGAINKTVDMVVGSEFSIKTDNLFAKKLCEEFMHKMNFDLYLRNVVKDLMIFGNSFTEIVTDEERAKNGMLIIKPATDILELKTLTPKYMYVRRDKFGHIIGFTQSRKRGDKIQFSSNEIAHYKYNVVGDCAYGYSIISPLVKIIETKLNMERSMMTLMDRKANAPIHVKLGTIGEPATSDDVSAFANDLYYLKDKTEWVTDHRVDIQTIDFAGKLMNFAPFNEHFENQLVYGLETPIVLLGRGSVPEGLATVQLEAWMRRIDSIRLLAENVIEEDIFKPLLKLHNIKGNVEIDWEPQSEDDKWKEVERITMLMCLVSLPMKTVLEERIAKILGVEIAPMLNMPEALPGQAPPAFAPQPAAQQPPQFAVTHSDVVDGKTVSGDFSSLVNTDSDNKPILNTNDMTISEWTSRNPAPLFLRISKFLEQHKFLDVDVSKRGREKLRGIMMNGMKDNVTLATLTNRIADELGVDKHRAEMIARTESVRATSEALLEDFQDKGIDKVRWIVIDDSRICEICEPMQGKVFKIEDAKGQIPKHVNCRCGWSHVFS